MKRVNITPKTLLAVVFIVVGLMLVGRSQRVTPPNTKTFASEPVIIENFESFEIDEEKVPTKILIPDLNIDIDVRKASIVSGYWEVFEDIAGWGAGSGLPGEQGNQVIFAHARDGLFKQLKNVETDMEIYVFTSGSWYEYSVTEIKDVYPNQTEVIEQSDDEKLTLYTCSGFSDSKRLIVVGRRV